MSEFEENANEVAPDDMNNADLRWLTTDELSPLVGKSVTTLRRWLESGDFDSVRKLDFRICDIKQVHGKGRTGLAWRFLWRHGIVKRDRRIGYFSVHYTESAAVRQERKAAIEAFAKSINIELNSIESDIIGRSEPRLRRLAKIIHNPLVDVIVTDQEFSLGGVHYECVKEILLVAGIKVICVPGLYQSAAAVKESYMTEIARMMSKLLLLGAPVEGILANMSETFAAIRRDENDPGIT